MGSSAAGDSRIYVSKPSGWIGVFTVSYEHLLPVLRVNDAKVALDLSGVVLAKYALKDKGEAQLQLSGEGELPIPLPWNRDSPSGTLPRWWREVSRERALPGTPPTSPSACFPRIGPRPRCPVNDLPDHQT
ncbi:hypothetical protein [Arthrobacter sp. MP_2.3]|uniref:hypothetical protein n=1 Tax=Arthrobacter sp. MP_2.3 TaxID=3349633 RepID=UPI0038D48D57